MAWVFVNYNVKFKTINNLYFILKKTKAIALTDYKNTLVSKKTNLKSGLVTNGMGNIENYNFIEQTAHKWFYNI